MDEISFAFASDEDVDFILKNDSHVDLLFFKRKIAVQEVLLIHCNGERIGWLRYSFFWDEIPFLNLIWILEGYRRQGIGRRAVVFWEDFLRNKGYDRFMVSTLSNETAQHFYRKLGYKDIGGFILPGEPFEIIMMKAE